MTQSHERKRCPVCPQLLPCVVEVTRWYDMRILEELWGGSLVPAAGLLCYGAAQALKFSVVHAAKLKPMLQQPPPSWQVRVVRRGEH